jgi:21S rRNA (GM2251-2'-O)-methyltransferase
VVSKASSGALEFSPVFNTRNMPKFLCESALRGWRVVGTSLGESSIPLSELEGGIPTVLVLGNEGFGLRTMVQRACATLVVIEKAPRAEDAREGALQTDGGARRGRGGGVDSLNVAVSGAIVMHKLLSP